MGPTRSSLATATALAALLASVASALPLDGTQSRLEEKREKRPPPGPEETAAMAARLGDLDWRAREQAMRGLIAAGPAARQALQAALRSPDAEVRWRADYALSALNPDTELPAEDPARAAYASAAQARGANKVEDAMRLYGEVIARFPRTRWAVAAQERRDALREGARAADRPPPKEKELTPLIGQLGAGSWEQRQEASRRLAALGEAAEAALEEAKRSPDPEIAWRARSLLERIDARRPKPKARRAAKSNRRLLVELLGEPPQPKARVGEGAGLAALVRTLSSDAAAQVAHAREILLNLGDDALDPLMCALQNCDEVAGVEIMDLLQRITREDLGFSRERWSAWWRAVQERGKD
jgi:hypothetical protein